MVATNLPCMMHAWHDVSGAVRPPVQWEHAADHLLQLPAHHGHHALRAAPRRRPPGAPRRPPLPRRGRLRRRPRRQLLPPPPPRAAAGRRRRRWQAVQDPHGRPLWARRLPALPLRDRRLPRARHDRTDGARARRRLRHGGVPRRPELRHPEVTCSELDRCDGVAVIQVPHFLRGTWLFLTGEIEPSFLSSSSLELVMTCHHRRRSPATSAHDLSSSASALAWCDRGSAVRPGSVTRGGRRDARRRHGLVWWCSDSRRRGLARWRARRREAAPAWSRPVEVKVVDISGIASGGRRFRGVVS